MDRSMGGFILGADATLDQRYRIGVAGGYTQSMLSVDARGSSGHVDSTYIGLYGGASFQALQIGGGALYAYNRYGTSRSIDFPGFADTASSGYGGDSIQAFAEAGWRIGLDGLAGPASIEPFVGAMAMHLDTGSFQETGGAEGLVGSSRGYDYETTTVGLRGEASLFAQSPLTARGMIGWRHLYGEASPTSVLAFASAPSIPFTVSGAPIARDALDLEAGIDWRVGANASLGVFYSGEFGAGDEDSAIKGRFEVAF
jgi:outer membrane autotransporter protein